MRRTAGIWLGLIGLAVQFAGLGLVWSVAGFEWSFVTLLTCLPVGGALFIIGVSVWGLFFGERLVLSPEGLLIQTEERIRRVHWSQIKQFRIERLPDELYPVIGWDHHDDAVGEGNPRWEGQRMAGVKTRTVDADISWGWDMQPDELCATLERWRVRYS